MFQFLFFFFFYLTKSNAFKQGSTLNCNGDDGRGRAISQNQPAPALYREASQPSNKAGKLTPGTKLPTMLVNKHNFIGGGRNKRKLEEELYLISHCLLCYVIRKDALTGDM